MEQHRKVGYEYSGLICFVESNSKLLVENLRICKFRQELGKLHDTMLVGIYKATNPGWTFNFPCC